MISATEQRGNMILTAWTALEMSINLVHNISVCFMVRTTCTESDPTFMFFSVTYCDTLTLISHYKMSVSRPLFSNLLCHPPSLAVSVYISLFSWIHRQGYDYNNGANECFTFKI